MNRLLSTYRLIIKSNTRICSYYSSKPYQSQPGPLPLGDKAQQKEMEKLISDHHKKLQLESLGVAQASLMNNELINKDATDFDPLKEFEDGINPITGERGGPKGKEPTRYGDWERKGRVYDF